MSTRKITEIQFEDQTILDGQSIDQAVSDIIETFNNVGPDVDASSTVQKQFVWGGTPTRPISTDAGFGDLLAQSPWLQPTPEFHPMTGAPRDIVLEERYKSNDPTGITMVDTFFPGDSIAASRKLGSGYIWQTAFWTNEPIIVTDLDVVMHMNEIEPQLVRDPNFPYATDLYDMKWFATVPDLTPYPLVVGDYTEDIIVSLTVDSPLSPQVASEVSLTVHKKGFSIDSQRMMEYNAGIPPFPTSDAWNTPDMLPSIPHTQFTRGIWIQAKEINAPIPAKSRVRINIFLPMWRDSDAEEPVVRNWWCNDLDEGFFPWKRTLWSNTLTFLERKA